MRRVGKRTLCHRILFFPVCASHIPVGKPFFFSFQILHFHVEDAIMSNERFEPFVVMSGQPIYRESSEAGTYASQTIFVHIRLFCHFIDSSEVILHTLATVIATNLFVPFHTESRQTATVRSNDDIIISCHNLEVPAIRPELAYRALRTSFTEQQSRIFLVRIKLWRINHPCQHLFTICCFHPATFHFTHFQLVIDLFVLLCQLSGRTIQCHSVNLITHTH